MVTQDLAVAASRGGSKSTEARADLCAATWRAESECRRHPTRWWFNGDHRETVLAKAICSGCVVREQCLEFALSRPDMFGIWASTTATQRATIRRDLRAPSACEPAPANEPVAKSQIVLRAPRALPALRVRPVESRVPADAADLLTPAEAAHKLGVTPNTVTRWSRAGKISAIQTMGGHRRFPRSEIERVLGEGAIAVSIGL
jgi:excisionase family DNA binding protein